jgi:hypothetical protein
MTLSWQADASAQAWGRSLGMSVLLVVGIGVFVAGLVTAAFGVPVKEFSFGNTLILSGAVVSCTGLIMISLSLVVRELRTVADRLRSGVMAADRGDDLRVPFPPAIEDGPRPLRDADQAAPNARSGPKVAPSVLSPLWQAETSTRDRAAVRDVPDIDVPEPPAFSDTPATPKPRRNLLFASSMRKERERPEPERASSAPSSAGSRAGQLSGLSSSVTVLRSGVVDGMAYSLYSDGTIEAQLPEGMKRFSSIDQLRAYLDQDPGRSSPK